VGAVNTQPTPAIPCPKQTHFSATHFAFLEEGFLLTKMINKKVLHSVGLNNFCNVINNGNI
ncbi:hypothetical protein ACT453_18055, partial [Bacillus sp. D-CC]